MCSKNFPKTLQSHPAVLFFESCSLSQVCKQIQKCVPTQLPLLLGFSSYFSASVCLCVSLMNTQMQKKYKKYSYSPIGHMNIALRKAVLPCSLKAKRRWNRCNMDFCSVSIHSVVSWTYNLKCINHPMNISFFSCSWKIQKQNLLAVKSFDIKNILNWNSFWKLSHMFSILLCNFSHISKDQKWYANRSQQSTSRPLSFPYLYDFLHPNFFPFINWEVTSIDRRSKTSQLFLTLCFPTMLCYLFT